MKSYLVIHHSATQDSDTVSWNAIRRFHRAKGWRDIGYNLGFEMIDGEPVGLIGRPLLARAAAEPREGANRHGVHVLFVGDYNKADAPDKLIKHAAPILADLCEVLGIDPERGDSIRTHASFRERFDGKTCPGTRFPIDRLRSLIRGAM